MDAEARGPRIAVIGGGITGAMAASTMASACVVHVYDQGRRGPGGRASHRAVCADTRAVLPDDPPIAPGALEFDHGCQFTRADDERMRHLVSDWIARGWAAEWRGRFGAVGKDGTAVDFFGLPDHSDPVYCGVGGMHTLPRSILADSAATVHRGVRVAGMHRETDGTWTLLGVGGAAAYHDTAEVMLRC